MYQEISHIAQASQSVDAKNVKPNWCCCVSTIALMLFPSSHSRYSINSKIASLGMKMRIFFTIRLINFMYLDTFESVLPNRQMSHNWVSAITVNFKHAARQLDFSKISLLNRYRYQKHLSIHVILCFQNICGTTVM